MGFLLVTSVLVVSLGRVGDIFGRVKMYTLGFAIFTAFSILLSVTWMTGSPAALWIIVMRVGQGVGGAFIFANSSAIITDAFPADERGFALGINGVAAIGGSFLGLLIGGLLAPIEWRLVFLVSVPFGVFGTLWAYLRLHDNGIRIKASIDWIGNIAFAVGLIAMLTGIVYGLQPYGGHTMGWTSPFVLACLVGGIAVLAGFVAIEHHVERPDVPAPSVPEPGLRHGQPRRPHGRTGPGRPAVHPDHLAPGDLAPAARLQLRADPTVGRHLHDPPHRRVLHLGTAGRQAGRPATAPGRSPPPGSCVTGLSLLGLQALPMDFPYPLFAPPAAAGRLSMGLFAAPNTSAVMNSLPADQRGAGGGMLNTFQNSAGVLSIGVLLHHHHPRAGLHPAPRRSSPA